MKWAPWLLCFLSGCRLAAPVPASLPIVAGARKATSIQTGDGFLAARTFNCFPGPEIVIRTLGSDAVDLVLPDQIRRLTRQRSASGVEYSDHAVTLWNKGQDAVLYRHGRKHPCKEDLLRSIRADAQIRGVQFRATGTENDWVLEMFADKISFTDTVYGRAIVPAAVAEVREGNTVYVSTTETHRLQLIIEQRECVRRMDGERFEVTVEVNLDGDGYRGCGYRP
jgi:uncharacterized membrane protein